MESLLNNYPTYAAIPPAKKAGITTRAKKAGKNPIMVHAGLKAAFTKKNGQSEAEKPQTLLEQYDSYEDIPPVKRAWITIRAKKAGKDPVMVHAGLKAAFTKKNGHSSAEAA